MSSTPTAHLHLAVALDGTGWHPASWREPVARPRDLFTAGYWADLVAEAERGLLDFVTFEDGLGLQSSHYVTPQDAGHARAIVAEIRAEQEAAGRDGELVHVSGDLVVFLDDDRVTAEDRRARLDVLAGKPYTSDARIFAGATTQLAELLQKLAALAAANNWSIRDLVIETGNRQNFIGSPATVARTIIEYVQADASDGFILVPHITPTGLDDFADKVVPLLQEQGVFRTDYEGPTLRHHLGLALPDDLRGDERVAS